LAKCFKKVLLRKKKTEKKRMGSKPSREGTASNVGLYIVVLITVCITIGISNPTLAPLSPDIQVLQSVRASKKATVYKTAGGKIGLPGGADAEAMVHTTPDGRTLVKVRNDYPEPIKALATWKMDPVYGGNWKDIAVTIPAAKSPGSSDFYHVDDRQGGVLESLITQPEKASGDDRLKVVNFQANYAGAGRPQSGSSLPFVVGPEGALPALVVGLDGKPAAVVGSYY
jgi:hypothetical protein